MNKKLYLFLFLLMATNSYLLSQSFYFEPSYSRSFAFEKSDFTFRTYNTAIFSEDSIDEKYQTETYHESLGAGNNYGIAIGYRFPNSIISTEVGFTYFKSNVLSFKRKDYFYFVENPIYNIEYNYNDDVQSTSFSITPSVKLTLNHNHWGFFLKSGLIFASCSLEDINKVRIFNTLPNYYPTESYSSTTKYHPKWEIGIQGMIGIDYRLFSWAVINTGVQYSSYGYRPASASFTKYEYRGKDELDDLPVSEKEFIYADSYTSADNDSENKPTVLPSTTYTFNNISIHFGIQFFIF